MPEPPVKNNPGEPYRSHLFTVRMWLEQLGRGGTEWRGKVQHVLTGQTRYFRDWQTLVQFIQTTLPKTLDDKQPTPFFGKEQSERKTSMILVVGATGQLGTAIVRKLVQANKPVRAFVRPTSDHQHLKNLGVELALGDLRDAKSVEQACRNIDVVIATANAVIPRKGDTFASVEGEGYRNLIAACQQQKVRQFIFASVPITPIDEQVAALHYKRLTEKRLQESGLDYTIVRLSVFMDAWLALIGSNIPIRGAESPTVVRPFWFSQMYMRMVGGLIENRGIAVLAGNGKARHAFITVDDAARFMVGCVNDPAARCATFHVGGPEVMSWNEAVALFGQVLGRKVTPIHAPAAIFRINQTLFKPFAEGPANIFGMNWMCGTFDSAYPPTDAYRILQSPMMTMKDFLTRKVKLAHAQIFNHVSP